MENSLEKAIDLVKSGGLAEGEILLTGIVKSEPNNERAWQWLSVCVIPEDQKRHCLKQVLRINPNNEDAKKLLESLEFKTIFTQSLENNKPVQPVPPQQKLNGVDGINQSSSKSTERKQVTETAKINTNNWMILGAIALIVIVGICSIGFFVYKLTRTTPGSPIASIINTATPKSTNTPAKTNTPKPTQTPAFTRTPRPTATQVFGSIKSPFPLGQPISLINTNNGQESNWTLTILDVIRGEEANLIVYGSNQFNDNPPAGTSWMLIKVRVTLDSGAAFTTTASDLAVISGGQFFAGLNWVCCTEGFGYPVLEANIASPGTSVEGWVIRPVLLNDQRPLLALNINSYNPNLDEGLYFSLTY